MLPCFGMRPRRGCGDDARQKRRSPAFGAVEKNNNLGCPQPFCPNSAVPRDGEHRRLTRQWNPEPNTAVVSAWRLDFGFIVWILGLGFLVVAGRPKCGFWVTFSGQILRSTLRIHLLYYIYL